MRTRNLAVVLVVTFLAAACLGQEYQPKFKGDPAKSEEEAQALGYMRTVVYAEKNYNAKKHSFAPTLSDLVGQGSFTKRMAASKKRGDYTVSYKQKGEGYHLTMTPDHIDPTHRAFYVDESGKIKAEEDKAATENSPNV